MSKGNTGTTKEEGTQGKSKEQIKAELVRNAAVAKNKKMIRDIFNYLVSVDCNLYDMETIVGGASGLLKEEVKRRQDVAICEMDTVQINALTLKIRESKSNDKEARAMNKKTNGLIDVIGGNSLLQANDQLPGMLKHFDEILVNGFIKEREDTLVKELFDIDKIL